MKIPTRLDLIQQMLDLEKVGVPMMTAQRRVFEKYGLRRFPDTPTTPEPSTSSPTSPRRTRSE